MPKTPPLLSKPEPRAWEADRLYGRSQGRPLRARQERLMSEHLPTMAASAENVAQMVESHPGEVWAEVGFGGGEHLTWQAERHPDALIIGAEPFLNGVAKLLGQVEDLGLSNIRICHGDAKPLLAAMPDGCLSKLFVLHPDPWPKARHHKRRMISKPFLLHAARLLKPGGELRVSSDIPDYVRWTLLHVQLHNRQSYDFVWEAVQSADWKERPSDWPQTRYDAKGVREGRPDTYLRFRRT